MKTPFIVGEKIYLRGLEKKDLADNLFNWSNDSEVTYYMYTGLKPSNLDMLEKEYDQLVHSDKDVVMAIVDKKTDAHIGNAGLYSINWLYRSAEFRIIIGEKKFWGKGYGTEATKLVIDYGFDKLNLNKLWLGVNADNAAAVKSYRNAGFVEEGVLRQEIYRNSKYYDAVRMSILREEFYGK
jgi:ribosomal-protein-alanine N-acetyltransferase